MARTCETLAEVIQTHPRWDEVPVPIRRLLRHSFEKDPIRLRDTFVYLSGEVPRRTTTARSGAVTRVDLTLSRTTATGYQSSWRLGGLGVSFSSSAITSSRERPQDFCQKRPAAGSADSGHIGPHHFFDSEGAAIMTRTTSPGEELTACDVNSW